MPIYHSLTLGLGLVWALITRIRPFLRHLGEPLGNVPLVEDLTRGNHDQQHGESTDDQTADVATLERVLPLPAVITLSLLQI